MKEYPSTHKIPGVEPPKKNAAARKANYTGGRPKDDSNLVTDPKQIRNRLRRAARKNPGDGRIARDVAMLYGKPVDEWDLEELARGRPRGPDGSLWRGPTPSYVTPLIAQRAKKLLIEDVKGRLAKHLPDAIRVMYDLMMSTALDDKGRPVVDARTQFAAAQFIIEHFIGKTTALIQLEENNEVAGAIAAAIVMDDGKAQDHFVIEGQLVDEDEEPDDE